MSWRWIVVMGVGFTLGFSLIGVFGRKLFSKQSLTTEELSSHGQDTPVVEVSWGDLRGLEVASGKMTEELRKLDGAKVKVPGFIIPLEDFQTQVSEFLLVPSPMACIHVPPPPPNQMVHVRMASGRRADMSYGPVWTHGRLKISESHGPYGKASFELVGERTEPYM